jgi:hypothetical protein
MFNFRGEMEYRTYSVLLIIVGLSLAILVGAGFGSNNIPPAWILGSLIAIAVMLWFTTKATNQAQFLLLILHCIMLTTYPVARVVAPGNLPIYLTDIIAFILLISLLLQSDQRREDWPYIRLLLTLLIFFGLPVTFFSFIHEVAMTGIWRETTYMLVRTVLSVSPFYLLYRLVRAERELHMLVWCLVIGITITAALSILNSILPPSSPTLQLIDTLSPAQLAETSEKYIETGKPVRSRALIGSPVPTGNAILLFFPLAYGLDISDRFKSSRWMLWAAILVNIMGVLATYSRGAILGLGLILLTLIVLRSSTRRYTLIFVILFSLVLLQWAEARGMFQAEFIEKKLTGAINDPTASRNDLARISAYQDMPDFLLSHPAWLVVGRGFATYDLTYRQLLSGSSTIDYINTENHSLLVSTFYNRGLVGMLVLIFIWFVSFSLLTKKWSALKFQSRDPVSYDWLKVSLMAGLVGMIPAWLFDHSFATITHMQTMLFTFWGLVIVAIRFKVMEAASSEG